MRILINRLRTLFGCTAGVSAVEFAVLAPFLVIGTLSTIDAGMAVYEKMMIGQVLRSGAHGAILAESEAEVLAILTATAGDNFTLAQGAQPGPGELAVQVSSYCLCPEDTANPVACTATCSSGLDPNRFYQLAATKAFDGVMLPTFALAGTIDVIAE